MTRIATTLLIALFLGSHAYPDPLATKVSVNDWAWRDYWFSIVREEEKGEREENISGKQERRKFQR